MTDLTILYDTVVSEFEDTELALMVVQALTVNLTTEVLEEDFIAKGIYSTRVEDKVRKLLWSYPQHKVDLAIRLWECYHSWTIGRSFAGLGGCVERTFKELLED
jgi:hypothetical protein